MTRRTEMTRRAEMSEDEVRVIREQGFTAGVLASCGESDEAPLHVLAERAGIEFGYMAAELDMFNDGFAAGWQMARQSYGTADTPAPR
ncbi:MAG: hypothetical protein WAW17_09475 [Rhodococcus sp. (in: high G+C Gram-positive bacteria)]|uniref:hypothetical protein n=1 Tax=Rhodococcus sp. TaxID=1831 RepID=UPI003BB21FDC